MSDLGKTVSHDYDPRIVFHSFSTNVPHLQSWIDELINLTEKSLPKTTNPTTDLLVQALQRYDAVYKELLRQTRIFSEDITRMLAQIWSGTLQLMIYMIKSYHRFVKHTTHLQSQAQNLLSERQKGEAASKVQKDEHELERTALRAQIRNLESENEALRASRRLMEQENYKLRSIIDVYIQSSEFNEPVWDIMKSEDPMSKPSTYSQQHRQIEVIDDNEKREEFQSLGFCRRQVVDAGKLQLKRLNRLDIEINEILTNVLKEENRQRLLMKDVMRLIHKNKSLFRVEDTDFGDEEITEEVDASNATNEAKVHSKRHMVINKRVSFVTSAINNGATHNDSTESAVQVDEKDELSLKIDWPEDYQVVDIQQWGVAPLAPPNAYVAGTEQPYLIRKCMTSFPQVQRIPPLAWACQVILSIYLDKLSIDDEFKSNGRRVQPLPCHVYDFFRRLVGVPSTADVFVAQLTKACEAHIRKQSRILLFASQVGLVHKESPPPMDIRDTEFIMHILSLLLKHGELQSDMQKHTKQKNVAHLSVHVRPDISRNIAMNVVHQIFQKWLPDGGEDAIIKVKTMAPSELGPKYIDIDMFIDALMEPWSTVRNNWEEHARYLFREYCTVYRVLQEATFAGDDGTKATDTVLMEMNKASATDCFRRPLRLFESSGGGELGEDTNDADRRNDQKQTQGNANKEPVCEMMSRHTFVEVVRIINPNWKTKEIEKIFDEALDLAHESVMRILEIMWSSHIDEASNYLSGIVSINPANKSALMAKVAATRAKELATNKEFFVNNRTQISQWTRPYRSRLFRTQDIDIKTFVSILLRHDAFAKSPLLDYLNIPPKDLWPNADMFYKQIKEKSKKLSVQSPNSIERIGLVYSPNSPIT